MALQYYAFVLGGLALLILVFPLRLGAMTVHRSIQQDVEFCSEDQLEAVAK